MKMIEEEYNKIKKTYKKYDFFEFQSCYVNEYAIQDKYGLVIRDHMPTKEEMLDYYNKTIDSVKTELKKLFKLLEDDNVDDYMLVDFLKDCGALSDCLETAFSDLQAIMENSI